MVLKEFIAKYDGKYVDDDGAYGGQCWDLGSKYAKEVIGCPGLPTRPGGNGGAIDCFTSFLGPLPQYFTKVENNPSDPNQVPKHGSIVIWGKYVGEYGDLAICVDPKPGSRTFTAFCQNTPVGAPAGIVERNYAGVVGWLEPKSDNVTPPPPPVAAAAPLASTITQYKKYDTPLTLYVNKDTSKWNLDFRNWPDAISAQTLRRGDKFIAAGEAHHILKGVYYMSDEDMGNIMLTGRPVHNEGVNSVDADTTPPIIASEPMQAVVQAPVDNPIPVPAPMQEPQISEPTPPPPPVTQVSAPVQEPPRTAPEIFKWDEKPPAPTKWQTFITKHLTPKKIALDVAAIGGILAAAFAWLMDNQAAISQVLSAFSGIILGINRFRR